MKQLRLGIILFSLAAVSSACGGGGSGGGGGVGSETIPQLIPSPITYTNMVAEVSAIRGASDTLLMTDVFLKPPSLPQGGRIQTVCGGGLCQAFYDGSRLVGISLLDFQLSDPADDHRFYTSLGGVNIVDVRGKDEEAGIVTDFKTLGG